MKKSLYWKLDDRLAYWHPVARSDALGRKPMSSDVCGTPIVLYRQGSDIHALYDRCAHRRAPLSIGRIENGRLVCAYHGCSFGPDGSGYCPSTKSNRFVVPQFETQVLCDTIWIRSTDALAWTGAKSNIASDLHHNEGWFSGVIDKVINAPLQLVMDNMTELEHTGEVHRMLAFDPIDYDTIETRCDSTNDKLHIFYRGRQRPLPLYLRLLTGLRQGDIYVQTADVEFQPPHVNYHIFWEMPGSGQQRKFSLQFIIYFTPATASKTKLFAFIFWQAEGTIRRLAMKMSSSILRLIVSRELERDKQIIESLPVSEAMIGMFQLNKFDHPLVKSREAMQRYYPETLEGINCTMQTTDKVLKK